MHTQPVLNPNALLITVKSNWLLILYYYTVLYSIHWMPVCLWGPTVYVIVLSLCLRLCFAKTAAVTAAAMVVFPIQQNSKMSNVQTLWWFWRKKIIATFSCTNELMSIIHTILILLFSSLVAIIYLFYFIFHQKLCAMFLFIENEKRILQKCLHKYTEWVYNEFTFFFHQILCTICEIHSCQWVERLRQRAIKLISTYTHSGIDSLCHLHQTKL